MLTLWVIKKYTIATTFLLVWTTAQDKDKDLNQKAQAWANKEKFQIVTGGADYHRESQRGNVSGIITEEKINTNDDLVRILRNGRYEINMG